MDHGEDQASQTRNTECRQRTTFEHKPRVSYASGMRGMCTNFKFVGDGIKEG